MYLGDFVGTETINHLFTTVQSSGAPTTLSGTPKLRCYKNGSTTESSDLTPTVDFDSRTGLNLVAIDLTGDSGFYATGSDYNIVITAGTVNSVSVVGYVVGAFSILHRSALRPATAGRTLVVDAAGLADANVVKIGPTGSGTAQTAGDVGAKTNFRLSATGVDDIWDEATSGHTTSGTYGDKIGAHLPSILKGLTTAGSDTTHVIMNASTGIDGAAPSATDDFYNGCVLIFTSGTMAGQRTSVTDYVGSTQTLTITAVTGSAASGVTFILV